MKSTRAVDVKIQVVSPLLISAKAGNEKRHKKNYYKKVFKFIKLPIFCILPPKFYNKLLDSFSNTKKLHNNSK